jgi:glycosyltransferase involved in cell wall biosynthesis
MEFLENLMKGISYDILKPFISESFTKQTLPPKPIVAVHSRDQRDSVNLIKSFYIKFPQYRWVTFRDMRGLSEEEFAKALKESFLSVWIDDTSAYGTFPLESMTCGVPVLGLTPNLLPSWMSEDNGIWINNKNQMVDFVADFLQNWLEDNVSDKLYEGGIKTAEKYSNIESHEKKVASLFEKLIESRIENFESEYNKQTQEQNV